MGINFYYSYEIGVQKCFLFCQGSISIHKKAPMLVLIKHAEHGCNSNYNFNSTIYLLTKQTRRHRGKSMKHKDSRGQFKVGTMETTIRIRLMVDMPWKNGMS